MRIRQSKDLDWDRTHQLLLSAFLTLSHTLTDGILKNSKAQLFSHEGGSSSISPRVVVETEYSEPSKKSRRDIRLC